MLRRIPDVALVQDPWLSWDPIDSRPRLPLGVSIVLLVNCFKHILEKESWWGWASLEDTFRILFPVCLFSKIDTCTSRLGCKRYRLHLVAIPRSTGTFYSRYLILRNLLSRAVSSLLCPSCRCSYWVVGLVGS